MEANEYQSMNSSANFLQSGTAETQAKSTDLSNKLPVVDLKLLFSQTFDPRRLGCQMRQRYGRLSVLLEVFRGGLVVDIAEIVGSGGEALGGSDL